MGYVILEASLFFIGLAICGLGKVPLSRRRRVQGAAAYFVGAILMLPLPFYAIASQKCHVPPLGTPLVGHDAFGPITAKFVHLSGVGAAFACVLVASVLAGVTSEIRPRKDHDTNQ
jgi:hypothetical protein